MTNKINSINYMGLILLIFNISNYKLETLE